MLKFHLWVRFPCVLQQQQPKMFLPKTDFSDVVQILKNICEGVQILTKLLATLMKILSSYLDISQ